MTDNASSSEVPKPTLGQAIDQIISALAAFAAADQQTILRAVYAHLNISGPHETARAGRTDGETAREEQPPSTPIRDPEYAGMDIKAFKELKKPSSARQMACVVAYYLAEIATGDEHKQVVTTADVEKYFKQGRHELPTKFEQLLVDARGAGYFESSGRGQYRLTRVGHNLVAHQLPAKGKGE